MCFHHWSQQGCMNFLWATQTLQKEQNVRHLAFTPTERAGLQGKQPQLPEVAGSFWKRPSQRWLSYVGEQRSGGGPFIYPYAHPGSPKYCLQRPAIQRTFGAVSVSLGGAAAKRELRQVAVKGRLGAQKGFFRGYLDFEINVPFIQKSSSF